MQPPLTEKKMMATALVVKLKGEGKPCQENSPKGR
jgi:hypothetical protein